MGRRFTTVLIIIVPVLLGAGCGAAGSEETPVPAAALSSTVTVPGAAATASTGTTIADDDGVGISEWLLSAANGAGDSFLPTLADIIGKAAPQIRFHVLFSSEDTRRNLMRKLGEAGFRDFTRIHWHEVASEISWWTRDLFVKGTSGGKDNILLLHHPDHYAAIHNTVRGDGRKTLHMLRGMVEFRPTDTRARIEGGGVVTDSRHAFIAPHYGRLAVDRLDFPDGPAFLSYLRSLYGRPVVMLDVPSGPAFVHPDMYLTPIGDDTVLLGSPSLAAKVMEDVSDADLEKLSRRLGRLGHEQPEVRALARATPREIRESIVRSPATEDVTRRMSRQLQNLGYRIIRVPWLALRRAGKAAEFRFSYNNVILERRGDQRTVYLPAYGIAELDANAKRTWEAQGFAVIQIDALGPAVFGGAVRCLSQVFRSPAPLPGKLRTSR